MENDMNTAMQLKQSPRVKHALKAVAAIRNFSPTLPSLTNANSNKQVIGVLEQIRIYRSMKKAGHI
jgi:hypothetical protein